MWMHIPFEIGTRKKKGVSELEVDFGCFLQVEKGCFTCGSTSTDFWTTSKVAKRAAFDLSWTWYEWRELKILWWCDGCISANLYSQYLEFKWIWYISTCCTFSLVMMCWLLVYDQQPSVGCEKMVRVQIECVTITTEADFLAWIWSALWDREESGAAAWGTWFCWKGAVLKSSCWF